MMSLEKRTSLCVNSFPRTGNTYLQQSLENIIHKNNLQVEFFSHNHDHILLLNPFVNQVSVLRDPESAVLSFILMYMSPRYEGLRSKAYSELQNLVDENLMLYVHFITNMLLSKNTAIIKFEDLVKEDINKICFSIFNHFNINLNFSIRYISESEVSANKSLNDKKNSSDIYLSNYPKDYSLIPERNDVINSIRSSKNFGLALDAYSKVYKTLEDSNRFLKF